MRPLVDLIEREHEALRSNVILRDENKVLDYNRYSNNRQFVGRLPTYGNVNDDGTSTGKYECLYRMSNDDRIAWNIRLIINSSVG